MTAAQIVQLIIIYGPQATELINKLISVWEKEKLSKEEVLEILSLADKSYESYISEAQAKLNI